MVQALLRQDVEKETTTTKQALAFLFSDVLIFSIGQGQPGRDRLRQAKVASGKAPSRWKEVESRFG